MMSNLIRKLRSRTAAFLYDILMIPLAWFAAYWLRFNLEQIPQEFFNRALGVMPFLVVIQGSVFWYFGLYRGVWRFASMPDLIRIIKAVLLGTLLSAVAIFFVTRLALVPRSVFPLYAIILMILLGGSRFTYRWIKDKHFHSTTGKRVLIVGAGRAGEMLARDLLRDAGSAYYPIAFVDDDKAKRGKEIHGIRVAGSIKRIQGVVEKNAIDLIMIAMPSANTAQMRRIVQLCEKTGVPIRTLPRLQDLVSGRASLKELREVSIEDLLGREQVHLDWVAINQRLASKTVLVTGGGGSIGSELCRQIARLAPSTLIILEQSEYNLYSIEMELRASYPDLNLLSKLGSVGDTVIVEEILREYRPQVIFHAAAFKHVPLLERQIRMAVLNNVLGTRTLANLADKYHVETFVMISTDKAVNPSNIMGTTKRAAEIYCQNLNAVSKTHFITVRFGNVLDSAGSVIPLFRQQIAKGGPVTVTHKDITRYFMTIPEASQLILQAGSMGQGGEIFVLDMGEPIKISYLAEQMIILSGKQPGDDIEITYTGLRPGEKLYEELFHTDEGMSNTQHAKIFKADSRSFKINKLNNIFDELLAACVENRNDTLRKILDDLVPENNIGLNHGDALPDSSNIIELAKNQPG